MSLLRSILAIRATTLRSALACALAAGAASAYYAAFDWEDVAITKSAEAVTMPPVVRLSNGGATGVSLQHAFAEPTADDLVPPAPPVVRAPTEPIYTGSVNAPPVSGGNVAVSKPKRSMLDHAWAPSAMLLPAKMETAHDDGAVMTGIDREAAQHAHVPTADPRSSGVAKTMTVSAVDAIGDEAMRGVMRTSVALRPMDESAETLFSAPPAMVAPVVTVDPAAGSAQGETDMPEQSVSGEDEDSDIAPRAVIEKKPAARKRKVVKRRNVRPPASAIEQGFYSLQRDISSFFY